MYRKIFVGTAGAVLLAVSGFFGFGLVDAQTNRSAKSVTGEQAVSCINTALASKAGKISGLDVEIKGGKTVCEVDIIGEDGRKYDVDVDAAANTVISTRPDR